MGEALGSYHYACRRQGLLDFRLLSLHIDSESDPEIVFALSSLDGVPQWYLNP